MRIIRARFYKKKKGVKGPTRGVHVAEATAFGVLPQTRYALQIVEANKKGTVVYVQAIVFSRIYDEW